MAKENSNIDRKTGVIGRGGGEAQGFLEEEGGQREPSVDMRGRPRYLFVWAATKHGSDRAVFGVAISSFMWPSHFSAIFRNHDRPGTAIIFKTSQSRMS